MRPSAPNQLSFIRPTDRPRWRFIRRFARAVLVFFLVLLIYFSLESADGISMNIQDKLLHYVIYGGLTGIIGLAYPRLPLSYIFIIGSGLGAGLEIGQGVMGQGRMASWADQTANMAGVLTAILVWVLYVYAARYFAQTR